MKIIVTGGAGFIGSNLVDRLIETGNQVIVIDNLSTGTMENVNPKAKFYLEDITDPRIIGIFKMERPDYVFHHAAQIDVQVSVKQPCYDAKVNIMGTINVLDACVKSTVKKIVYASSAAVFGEPVYLGIDEQHVIDPVSFYGISKHTPEHYLKLYFQQYRLGYTILRYANVYGIRQEPKGEGGVISIFVDKILQGLNPVVFGDGDQTRDFVYVKDIVAANIAAIKGGDGYVLNIGTGKQITINGLVELVKKITNNKIQITYQPERSGDIRHSYFNNEKAKKILGWEPQYTLELGLRETIEYYALKRGRKQNVSVPPHVRYDKNL